MKARATRIEKMHAVINTLKGSGYKMGDTFTLIVHNDIVTRDAREWYSGRGAKYNKSVRHGDVRVKMSIRELNDAYAKLLQAWKEEQEIIAARAEREAKMRANAASPIYIALAAVARVEVVTDQHKDDESGRYWLGVYHGCGVYRLVIKDGKIVAGIHGGYHGSCPPYVAWGVWIEAINKRVAELFGDGARIVKADGSGTYFFIREHADDMFIDTKTYAVPSAHGGQHVNYQIV